MEDEILFCNSHRSSIDEKRLEDHFDSRKVEELFLDFDHAIEILLDDKEVWICSVPDHNDLEAVERKSAVEEVVDIHDVAVTIHAGNEEEGSSHDAEVVVEVVVENSEVAVEIEVVVQQFYALHHNILVLESWEDRDEWEDQEEGFYPEDLHELKRLDPKRT